MTTSGAEKVSFPDLEAPPSSSTHGQTVNVPKQPEGRMVVTGSTLRDPFRHPPPSTLQELPRSSDASSSVIDPDVEARVRQDTDAAIKRGGRAPQRWNTDKGGKARRKNSTHTPEKGIDYRSTLSRDSDSNAASKSGTSDAPISSKGHRKSPSRDEHATRGLFTLGMFNRRRSSVMTSFDSELAPKQCMVELGRTLMAMDCEVLMKRGGETKMKCEAPVRNTTLSMSILCTQQNGVSNVQFRRGKRDRSNIDSKEFYDFCQMVQYRYQERVKASSRKS
ncbi:unnamed protein product [Agarophyton chilense]